MKEYTHMYMSKEANRFCCATHNTIHVLPGQLFSNIYVVVLCMRDYCVGGGVGVTSPRWRRGAARRSLDDSKFGAISRGSGAFAADGLSSMHTGHILEPVMQLPIGSRHRFCHDFVSVSIEAQQLLRSVGLHLSTPPFHCTPLGSLELAVGPYRHHDHKWLQHTGRSTWWPRRPFQRPRCPAATHPRAVWRGPGQPTYLTVCRPWKQQPALRPLWARRPEEVCVCVHVCVCVSCVCVCVHV